MRWQRSTPLRVAWKSGRPGSWRRWAGREGPGELVQLRPAKGLPKRSQRGGKDFTVEDAYTEVVSEYATLFLDRVPEAAAAEAVRRVLAVFGVPDNELTRMLSDAVTRRILRDIRGSLPKSVEELVKRTAPLITRLSQTICRIIPGCTADTVSQEVADRKGTTIQGAHAWMVRPIIMTGSPKSPPVIFAMEVLRVEAAFACRQHGTANSLREFYTGREVLTGEPMFGDALRAINRGCKE